MSRLPVSCAFLSAMLLAALPAHAEDPSSYVHMFEWAPHGPVAPQTLAKPVIIINQATTLAEGTLSLLADPKQPAWTMQNGKLIVPSCNTSLVGPLKINVSLQPGHKSSALHWTIAPHHSATLSITKDYVNSKTSTPGAEVTWAAVDVPIKPGDNVFNLQAWTSKGGQKSKVQSAVLKATCTEAPKPTIPPQAAQKITPVDPKPSLANVPGVQLTPALTALEVKSVRLDFGFPDANAVQWYKGQPATKEIFLHEITGPGSEPGGSKWGVVSAVTAGGQTVQSRAVDSCGSALKLKKYFVHVKNNGITTYGGGGKMIDLKASSTGPNGSFMSNGDLPSVASNLEGIGTIDTTDQGVVFLTSGNYNVKAELLPPAASNNPQNNAGQFTLTFKCKALNATTWQ